MPEFYIRKYSFERFQSMPKAQRDAIMSTLDSDQRMFIARDYMRRFKETAARLEADGYRVGEYDEQREVAWIMDTAGTSRVGELPRTLIPRLY